MKIREDAREITVTQRNLAKILGLTPERIRQLVIKGIIKRDEKDDSGGVYLVESLQRYYKQSLDTVEYDKEHALLEQIKRKTAELKLQKARGELYDAKTIETVITQDLLKVRTQLLSIPIKLSGELEGKSKGEIFERLTAEIETALREISEYDAKIYTREVQDNENA